MFLQRAKQHGGDGHFLVAQLFFDGHAADQLTEPVFLPLQPQNIARIAHAGRGAEQNTINRHVSEPVRKIS